VTRTAIRACCGEQHATLAPSAASLFTGLTSDHRAIQLARINAAIAYTETQRHRPNIARADDKLRDAATVLSVTLGMEGKS
jgi:hypothetical protein